MPATRRRGPAGVSEFVGSTRYSLKCGVYVFDGANVPDLGILASAGLNNFSALAGVASVEHQGTGTVMAIGNTWANTPPQVGVDIVIDGGGSVVTE
jgi:hypothetical protein